MCYNIYMGIYTLILSLLCISAGTFAVGVVTGGKLGSCYKKDVALKTSFVFVAIGLLAIAVAFILGRLLSPWVSSVSDWLIFVMLFLVAVQLMLESIEKSPSLNFTDIIQNTYMVRVAVQTALPSFFIGFAVSLSGGNMILVALFFSALFTFITVLLGIVHGNTFNKTVLHSRLQLIAGIVMLVLAVRFLIVMNA